MELKPKIYFIKDIEDLVRRDRLTLRRWWNAGKFPVPTIIYGRVAWESDVVNLWLENQFKNQRSK